MSFKKMSTNQTLNRGAKKKEEKEGILANNSEAWNFGEGNETKKMCTFYV